MRDPRYDILFEPVQIGPVTAKNRFYQVPHCNGLGYLSPKGEAAFRGIKAEGGWAVVSNQETDIHPASDSSPYVEAKLWDREDMKRMRLSVDAIHQHDALAAVELGFYGHAAHNGQSRLPVMSASEMIIGSMDPMQPYCMGKKDIANVRRWHKRAALRCKQIGYDIVYVYAAHDIALPFHFISPKYNRRSDEYGGSLENRIRFLRELLEDTKDAVGDDCGIALRFAVDELLGDTGLVSGAEGREVVEMLAEVPDIWDVNISRWANDSQSSRFSEEGFQEEYIKFVKQITGKPVVGVGRFTSPDAMVSQIKRGVLDMIGAARPSIADPFLPKKIEQGRIDDIRECIGCNICIASDNTMIPIRCTQNPTSGEEYRRNWHPETISANSSSDAVLIVGAGPAGLEAAMSLGRRGCRVVVADASDSPGGRVITESRLPGLSEWKRVVDYRLGQIEKLDQVDIFLQSSLDKEQVLTFAKELDIQRIVIATGSKWDDQGVGRNHYHPIPRDEDAVVLTPDDIMANTPTAGHIAVYDDDHYYMGSAIAEALAMNNAKVTFITPAADVSAWTHNTLEQGRIESRLHDLGVTIKEKFQLSSIQRGAAVIEHVVSGQSQRLDIEALVMVTARCPRNGLFFDLDCDPDSLESAGIKSVTRIGDCLAPSTIAAAVYEGHRYAREFDQDMDIDEVSYKREYIQI